MERDAFEDRADSLLDNPKPGENYTLSNHSFDPSPEIEFDPYSSDNPFQRSPQSEYFQAPQSPVLACGPFAMTASSEILGVNHRIGETAVDFEASSLACPAPDEFSPLSGEIDASSPTLYSGQTDSREEVIGRKRKKEAVEVESTRSRKMRRSYNVAGSPPEQHSVKVEMGLSTEINESETNSDIKQYTEGVFQSNVHAGEEEIAARVSSDQQLEVSVESLEGYLLKTEGQLLTTRQLTPVSLTPILHTPELPPLTEEIQPLEKDAVAPTENKATKVKELAKLTTLCRSAADIENISERGKVTTDIELVGRYINFHSQSKPGLSPSCVKDMCEEDCFSQHLGPRFTFSGSASDKKATAFAANPLQELIELPSLFETDTGAGQSVPVQAATAGAAEDAASSKKSESHVQGDTDHIWSSSKTADSLGFVIEVGQKDGFFFKAIKVRDTVTCSICQKLFHNDRVLDGHIRKAHIPVTKTDKEGNPVEIQCMYCRKTFKNDSNLRRHFTNVHAGAKNHSCDRCSSPFNTLHSLVCHRRDAYLIIPESRKRKMRSLGRPSGAEDIKKDLIVWRCLQCGLVLSSKGNVRRHITIRHLKLKPYRCKTCGACFGTEHNLHCHESAKHANIRNKAILALASSADEKPGSGKIGIGSQS